MRSFDDIVGDGLEPEEEAKLRRIHDLLVQAGPPADLPPSLEQPVEPEGAVIVEFPLLPRRRWAAAATIAATLVLAAFAGGYFWGHTKAKPAAFATWRVVPMHGAERRLAVVRIGEADSVGNWPMEFEVTGLPKQQNPAAYYELWLTRNGKPVAPCGSFRVHGKTTTVSLNVPYSLKRYDGWVVTEQPAGVHTLGRVVLTT